MNKFRSLSTWQKMMIILKKPLKVLNSGILAQQDDLFKRQIRIDYKIEKLPTIDLLDLFPNLEGKIECYSFLEGTSLITDILLLKKIASQFDSCKYLEIGSWRGESVVNISENAAHCTTINLPKEEMRNMNLKKEFIDLHGFFSKNLKNVSEIAHNSKTFNFDELDHDYNLIFIDGDHSYEGVLNDTKKTFNLRKDDKSIIVWHDYGYSPERVRFPTLKAILDGVPASEHKNLYHVSNTLCAVYIENCHLPRVDTEFPSVPNKKFSLTIHTERI